MPPDGTTIGCITVSENNVPDYNIIAPDSEYAPFTVSVEGISIAVNGYWPVNGNFPFFIGCVALVQY